MVSPSANPQTLDGLGVTYEELLFYGQQHIIGKRLLLGAVTMLLYDYIVTFEEELNFVWRVAPRFSLAKLLFIVNRYLPIITFTFRFVSFEFARPSICSLVPVFAALLIFNFATIELILLLRVWVLYSRSRRLGILLGTLFLTSCGTAFYIRVRNPDVALLHSIRTPPLSLTICPRTDPKEYFFGFIIVLAIDVISFSMVMWKVYITWKVSISTPVLTALLMHGSAYYLMVTTVVLFSVVAVTSKTLAWPIMVPNIAICLPCIAANRLVLSLRGLCYMDHLDETPIASMDSDPVYDLRALSQFRERNSAFEVFSPHYSAVDVAMEEEDYNRRKQWSST